jgi:hypothetical protein
MGVEIRPEYIPHFWYKKGSNEYTTETSDWYDGEETAERVRSGSGCFDQRSYNGNWHFMTFEADKEEEEEELDEEDEDYHAYVKVSVGRWVEGSNSVIHKLLLFYSFRPPMMFS